MGVLQLLTSDAEILRGRRKELTLLAYIALRTSRSASREELAELLWGDRPEANARQSLRQALTHLRRETNGLLLMDDRFVAVAEGQLDVDVVSFERAVSDGRLGEAVELWGGEFLEGGEDLGGATYRAWLEAQRESLRARLAWSLDRLVSEAETRGAWSEAARMGARWARAFPLDERAHHRFIEALHLSGQADEAVSRHAEFAARVRRELETEPSESFVRLGGELGRMASPTLHAASSVGSTVLFTPDLVGRDHALTALETAFVRACRGTMQIVVVEGEAGIGKTRLCDEFVRRLSERAQSSVVLRTRGNRANPTAEGSAARSLMEGFAGAPGFVACPPGALHAITRLAPSLRARLSGAVDDPWPLERAIERAFAEVAVEAPVVVVLDDVAWADATSQALIASLVEQPRQMRVLLLVTVQTDEEAPGRAIEGLRAAGGAQRLRLSPLDAGAIEQLVESMLDMPTPERRALSARLHAESAGNPFLVIQLLAALLDEDRITADENGRWRLAIDLAEEPMPQPSKVRDAVARRLDRLTPPARKLAEAVAALAMPADPSLLRSASRLSEAAFESALEELLARRLLRSGPQGQGYEFVHEVSRRVTYDLVSPADRRTLHATVCRAIKAHGFGDGASLRSAYQHHRKRAGRVGSRPTSTPMLAGAAVIAVGLVVALLARRPTPDFAERDWIVLADLENNTGDRVFDRSLVTALAATLAQSQHVNVVPPNRVYETLGRMRQDTVTRLTESVAREVAVRENARALVHLQISAIDTMYVLTARVVNAESGDEVEHLTARAKGKSQVLPSLDDLARRLRRALGESRGQIARRGVPLPRATTSSLDALKRFADGSAAWSDGRWQDARALWTEAVALDSNFARAHAALGGLYYWTNNRAAGDLHYDRALDLVDRLPERERMWTRTRLEGGRGNVEEAINILRVYVATYPDDRDAWANLGVYLKDTNRCADAIGMFERALAIDSGMVNATLNIAVCQDLLGRHQEAANAFEYAFSRDPSARTGGAGFDINRIYGFVYLKLGDSARARRIFEDMLVGDRNQKANGYRSLALAEMYYGRYAAGISYLREAVLLNQAAGARVSEFRNRMYLAAAFQAKGLDDSSLREIEIADRIAMEISLPPAWLAFLAQRYARDGNVTAAARVRDSIASRMRQDIASDRAALERIKGEILLARGEHAAAVDAFELAYRLDTQKHVLEALARGHMVSGNVEQASVRYLEILENETLGWEAQDAWIGAHYQLGRLNEYVGNHAAALGYYQQLAEIWRGGDEDLILLADTRSRIDALLRAEGR